MPRMNRLSSYKTVILTDAVTGVTNVIYHTTSIVAWNATQITLSTGGWQSVTTKRKMNQASRQFNLGYGVFQKRGEWFVCKPDGATIPFDTAYPLTFERV
jgi:hypothetical protein